jgi:hypothetical protein
MSGIINAADFPNKVSEFLGRIRTDIPLINAQMAQDCLSEMLRRINEDHTNARGESFGQYSTNQVPLFFYKNGKLMAPFSSGALIKGAEDKLNKLRHPNKKVKGVANALSKASGIKVVPTLSYKDWREMNNLPTDSVTLSFTGETLRDFAVIETVNDGLSAITTVASKNSITKKNGVGTEKIAEYLQDRYGDFMTPNPQEEELMAQILDLKLQKLLDETFEA